MNNKSELEKNLDIELLDIVNETNKIIFYVNFILNIYGFVLGFIFLFYMLNYSDTNQDVWNILIYLFVSVGIKLIINLYQIINYQLDLSSILFSHKY